MNLNTKLLLASALCVTLAGCNKQTSGVEQALDASLDAEFETQAYVPETREQQQAYALGSSLAMRLTMGLEHSEQIGVEVDQNYVAQGFNDALAGAGLIAPAASTELLEELQEQVARATAELTQPAG